MNAPESAGVRINLGCGNKRLPGFLGVDKFPCAGADLLCDGMKRLPFKDDAVDEVMMDNFIEHVLDVPALMQEVLRVCRAGATVTVITPHFTALASWRDPTHVHHFSYFSMDHFEKENVSHYIGKGFRVTRRRLSFGGGVLGLLGKLIFSVSPEQYEKKWCFMFRASTLTFELAVGK